MRGWWATAACLALSIWSTQALEVKMDETEDNRQRCSGMYSKSAWGGSEDPFILIKFLPTKSTADPVVSLVLFEWKDEDYIGVYPTPDSFQKLVICEPKYVDQGYCNSTDIGEYILSPNATQKSTNLILTKAIHLNNTAPIKYDIKKTGYYCILTDKYTADDYTAVVVFRNAYGELPATQIPKLPFYGGITLLYLLVVVFWSFLYWQHRADILAVQNYITAILLFLVVEMLMTWGFYDYLNRNGANLGSKALLVVVGILNAGRNSFSFFLLLIVCMGYGVVKTTLGQTMVYVRWLAIAHFVFGLIYAITSLVVTPEAAGPFVLLIVLPLAGTLTAFYAWTLNSLNLTLKDLKERRQHAKESMYRKLWWCILLSIMITFGFFFLNSFSFASARDPDYVPFHWKSRWFLLDGWLNLVYFADVTFVAYVWRPTANNRRFAMSDELGQDEDGTFEINNLDIGAPDDSDEDEEAGKGRGMGGSVGGGGGEQAGVERFPGPGSGGGSSDTPSGSTGTGGSPQFQQQAPKTSTVRTVRESLDGETIFAVGEDGDRLSDDESDEEEALVKGKGK